MQTAYLIKGLVNLHTFIQQSNELTAIELEFRN